MLFAIRIPRAPLSSFIENFWFYEGVTVNHTKERLLPDGAIELIIDLTDTPKHIYDAADLREIQTCRRAWISGQHSRHIVIEAQADSSMIGVRFRPGGLYPFMRFPVSELNDCVVDLDALWGGLISEIRDRVLEAETPETKFDIMEEMLTRKARLLEVDPTVRFALAQIMNAPGELSIRTLAAEAGISQRQLTRKFDERVGLKPKFLARVFRLQSVIGKAQANAHIVWSRVANDCGYFDQAHMIHEFQELTGMTPSQYLARRGEYPNFVPVL